MRTFSIGLRAMHIARVCACVSAKSYQEIIKYDFKTSMEEFTRVSLDVIQTDSVLCYEK